MNLKPIFKNMSKCAVASDPWKDSDFPPEKQCLVTKDQDQSFADGIEWIRAPEIEVLAGEDLKLF